jgi:hypothetical protein
LFCDGEGSDSAGATRLKASVEREYIILVEKLRGRSWLRVYTQRRGEKIKTTTLGKGKKSGQRRTGSLRAEKGRIRTSGENRINRSGKAMRHGVSQLARMARIELTSVAS